MKKKSVYRFFLREVGKFSYGVDYGGVFLVLFGYVTEQPAKGAGFFRPEDQKGILLLEKMPASAVRCATIEAGTEDRWTQLRPELYHPTPVRGRDGVERYSVNRHGGRIEYLSKEEVERGGFWPRESLRVDDGHEEQLKDIVKDWPTREIPPEFLDQGTSSPLKQKEAAATVDDFVTIRFSLPTANQVSAVFTDPDALASKLDRIEERFSTLAESSDLFELATPGIEPDGEIFWIVEVFTKDEKKVNNAINIIEKEIGKVLGRVELRKEGI